MPDLPLVQELFPPPDPAACCECLEGWPYRLWLDSASNERGLGRFSFLTADPSALLQAEDRRLTMTVFPGGASLLGIQDPFEALRKTIEPFRAPAVTGVPPFQGGLAGYIGYEAGGVLEKLPPPRSGLQVPDLAFGLYDWTLAWDHAEGRAWLISTGIPEHEEARYQRAKERMALVLERIRGVLPLLPRHVRVDQAAPSSGDVARNRKSPDRPSGNSVFEGEPPATVHSSGSPALPFGETGSRELATKGLESSLSRQAYLEAVRRVREYILAGDIYQANVAQRFTVPLSESPWRMYIRLREHNPAPFSAFLDMGALVIASVSPERFLRLTSEGVVEARPIKGTRPRGGTPDEDAQLARDLMDSDKDRAEHLMIVDLMRNDLSRVCAPGTVRASELFALEHYATVHHLVSTVTGHLERGRDAIDLLRATFPGGSITGAPKIRAMEIIAELEPVRRDVYCGSVAYLSVTGALDASIVIRTVLVKDGLAHCSAGGGIVSDSVPEAEYAESWDKARGLLKVLGADMTSECGDQ